MVLIGSVAGRMGGLVASAHYVASKGGLHAVVKWLAKRGAPHGVLVNGIAPGAIETEMTRDQPLDPRQLPLGRKGRPTRSPGRSRSCARLRPATSRAPCSMSTVAYT